MRRSSRVDAKLASLYDEYREDPRFKHLRREHTYLVPGEGPTRPAIFMVGEAPGAAENLAKRPFVGASGKALRSLMEVNGISADLCFVTTVVKYRPPGNRTPGIKEILDSTEYLRREWSLLGGPTVMVAVGATAYTALGPAVSSVTAMAGQAMLRGRGEPFRYLWPMLHPAYGLRHPAVRPTMERHWENFAEWLREEGII